MKKTKRAKRPQWARSLDARTWRHLQECQYTSRPTLHQLRADVQYQQASGVVCGECSHALRVVTREAAERAAR